MTGASPWQVVVRRDTTQMWQQFDPVLGEREPALDTTDNTMRLGDGIHHWSELPVYRVVGEATLRHALADFDGDALVTERIKVNIDGLVAHLLARLNPTIEEHTP